MKISISPSRLSCESGTHLAATQQWKHQGGQASVPAFRDIVPALHDCFIRQLNHQHETLL